VICSFFVRAGNFFFLLLLATKERSTLRLASLAQGKKKKAVPPIPRHVVRERRGRPQTPGGGTPFGAKYLSPT
jgi:hypothetical protein